MPNIGPLELGILLLVVLIIFGPKRLPGLGRQLGTGMREFKDSITGKDKDGTDDEDERDAVRRQAIESAPPPPTTNTEPAPTAEPEVVAGDTRQQDQPASRAD